MSSAEVLRWEKFPRRTIHLDFHTSPHIPDVGVGFDADAFARTFKDAHVDSVTVFAKCHHGRLYFDTDRPERHPGLDRGLDLMGQQIEALHGVGIKAPIYVSIQCDEYAADLHQDWVALTPELVQVRHPMTDAYHAGWQTLDMSSPYQEFVASQIEEILGRYGPVDGMFLDMCWDQPSSSRWAMAGMKGDGLDPASAEDRANYARVSGAPLHGTVLDDDRAASPPRLVHGCVVQQPAEGRSEHRSQVPAPHRGRVPADGRLGVQLPALRGPTGQELRPADAQPDGSVPPQLG